MKKRITVWLALFVLMLQLCPIAMAQEQKFSYYICGDKRVNISGYLSDDPNMVIPAELDGNKVNCVDMYAFQNNLTIRSVTISSGVFVDAGAFNGCTNLQQVTYEEGTQVINNKTFENCSSLKTVVFPKSLEVINQEAFSGCTQLESIQLQDTAVTKIGINAFKNCSALANITLPDRKLKLCKECFDQTAYVQTEDNWQDDALYIGKHLIQGAKDIEGNYNIKTGTKSIAEYAFEGCENLTGVVIPYSITEVGRGAFKNCTSLSKVIIPDSVTLLEDESFYNCDALKAVYIPENVKLYGTFTYTTQGGLETRGGTFGDCDGMQHFLYARSREQRSDLFAHDIPHTLFDGGNMHFDAQREDLLQCGTYSYCAFCDQNTTNVCTTFADIKSKDWFVQNGSIDYVYNAGLFQGTKENAFSPSLAMSRGMFVTVLGRLHGVSIKKAQTRFEDVLQTKYYSGYVEWADQNGIVNGVSDNCFAPDQDISRQQICAILLRYMEYADISSVQIEEKIKFTDSADISAYARKAVAACQMSGIINGSKTKGGYAFRPTDNATRAEVATILCNFARIYL